MGNMSYCRFENTLGDMRDCYDAMGEKEQMSQTEMNARKNLILLCVDVACEYGHEAGKPCEEQYDEEPYDEEP